jgi:hypothetical protein
MPRPTSCRYCGEPITQAKTGRPKQWCSDRCYRAHRDVMRSLEPRQRPPLGAPLFHSADAERRLRALHAELRSTSRSCYTIANELQLSGDSLNEARFADAGRALEHVLDAHFADLEGKP